ncbi:MAG: DUF29 domain-containing protein [Caldilineaceae bacterium]
MTTAMYKTDFYGWTQRQASLLQNEDFAELDLPHLIEEIEAMGQNQRHALASHLIGLLLHLLKYAYQPQRRTQSWLRGIDNHRTEIELILEYNHSLATELPDQLVYVYPKARRKASKETGLAINHFPENCPWTSAQILDLDWLP